MAPEQICLLQALGCGIGSVASGLIARHYYQTHRAHGGVKQAYLLLALAYALGSVGYCLMAQHYYSETNQQPALHAHLVPQLPAVPLLTISIPPDAAPPVLGSCSMTL